ncbi:hypothetical protein [Natronococcus wangiae]|uniref:hypothetical protein n=1 Tax=Natronococcus wangiae TaxID=3068275 RepID=UPI0027400F7E|nr:hypothetical protein [Natronococcus sp. AD5]
MDSHSNHDDHDESREPDRGYEPEGRALPGGLSLAANGLRFEPSKPRLEPGERTDWTFRIVDGDEVVTDFGVAHGERGHLIVVRRDLTRFQHRHPELGPDGVWRVEDLVLPDPGVYRAFVDVVVDGHPTTLGFDLFASGTGGIEARPDSSRRDVAGEYEVELVTDEITAGGTTRLTFEVRRDDESVPHLDRYLGSLGHLVALREGDLAYLHVHPEETAPESGRVEFSARFPTPGRYRLFFQTKPKGELVTTQFDVRIDA